MTFTHNSHLLFAAAGVLLASVSSAQMPMGYKASAAGIPANATRANDSGLVICRAAHQGGSHPGYVQANGCHISWGGQEFAINRYSVLTGEGNWAPAIQGISGAYPAGVENGAPLLLCRAWFNGGLLPGKVVDGSCNIPADGSERALPQYEVFRASVRSMESTQGVRVTFHNPSSENVAYYWVAYDGLVKKYGDIGPGQDVTVDTFASHPWLFDIRSNRLGVYTASNAPNQYQIVSPDQLSQATMSFVAPVAVSPDVSSGALIRKAERIAAEALERQAIQAREREAIRNQQLDREQALIREQQMLRERERIAGREAARQVEEQRRMQLQAEEQRLAAQRQQLAISEQRMAREAAERAQREAIARQAEAAKMQRAADEQRLAAQRQQAAMAEQRMAREAAERAQREAAARQQAEQNRHQAELIKAKQEQTKAK